MNPYLLLASLLVIPGQAFAYLDPGSASIFIQILLGGIAIALSTLKLYWGKLASIFHKKQEEPQPEENKQNIETDKEEKVL